MSELSSFEVGNMASYQGFVADVRSQNLGLDWKLNSADFLNDETLEALTQHGDGEATALFFPDSIVKDIYPFGISSETKFAVADELGDSLWFIVDCLDRTQTTVTDACALALNSFGIEVDPQARTFNDIQEQCVSNADKIRYISKAGLMLGYNNVNVAPDHFVTTLPQNPLLHFTRTNRKLTRALEEGSRDVAPYASGADFEKISEIPLAAGQHLLTLAWIADARLGITFNGIAAFNHDKLLHRELHGKKNDIKFDGSYSSL